MMIPYMQCFHQTDRLTSMPVLKGADASMLCPSMARVLISPTSSAWRTSSRFATLNTLTHSTGNTSGNAMLDPQTMMGSSCE